MAKHMKDPFAKREAKKYENPIPSREYILTLLKGHNQFVTHAQLSKMLALKTQEQNEALRRRLIAMSRDGQLMSNRRGSYGIVDQMNLVRGYVTGHKDGFGFLARDGGGEDVFLSARQMSQLFSGDRVLVRIDDRGFGRPEGIVIEVLERNTKEITGRFCEEDGVRFVIPANKVVTQDVLIPPGKEKKAKPGQIVTAKIILQPQRHRQATGEIIEILGDHMAPGMEIDIAIRSYGLPFRWPEKVEQELAHFTEKVDEKDKKNRADLRNLPLVTIDGEDAKDFDDAVYCKPKSDSTGWLLYVAIADVSHYVKVGTVLNEEAINRGNSVYFPGRVVPMLPEILSNTLCSLQPNVDRLCMVCEMEITRTGEISQHRFYNAVMRSRARLTYTEVAAMLEGKTNKKMALFPYLKNLHELFKVLYKKRQMRGAIEFETTETRIDFDKNGKIKKIMPVVRNDAHRLIEECMLAANVCAADFLLKHKIPTLFRVHEGPDKTKLKALRDFLAGFGLKLQGADKPNPRDYGTVLKQIEGKPEQHLIQTVLLRSLQQAVYAPKNLGHFGLAYEAYAHFTSPIRRYPDLLVHRAIRHILTRKINKDFVYDVKTMQEFGEHFSTTERRADEATRDAVNWLKCEYMMDKVGQKFDGIISGVTNFGIFVELKDIYVEGLVHISGLKNDYYQFDATRHRLIGRHNSAVYRLGDSVCVQVARVDLNEREIDFELL